MKSIVSVVIALAIVIGFSSKSFAFSEAEVKDYISSIAYSNLKKFNVVDLSDEKKIEILVHSSRDERKNSTLHFLAANVTVQSEKLGEIVVAVYGVLLEKESKIVGEIKNESSSASYQLKSNVSEYEKDLKWFQALAANHGNESLAMIALH